MTVTVNDMHREMCNVENTKVDGLGWGLPRDAADPRGPGDTVHFRDRGEPNR